ncbi:hypothetical protein CHUAL_003940 [Chamberlinius hualienensis]
MSSAPSINQSIKYESGFVKGFYPLALLANICGYFPFLIFKKNLSYVPELKLTKHWFNYSFTIWTLTALIYSCIIYYITWPNVYVNQLRDAVHNAYFLAYRFNSLFILMNFVFFRRKSFSAFLNRVCQTEFRYGNSTSTQLRQQVTVVGSLIAAFSLFNVISYTIINNSLYMNYHVYSSWIEAVLVIWGMAMIIYSYSFVSSLVVFFAFYFKCQFTFLNDCLKKTLECNQLRDDKLCYHLCAIRKRHEQMVKLVEEFNTLMSFHLLVYSGSESVSICVNFYELCLLLLKQSKNDFLFTSLWFIFVRLCPFILVCTTSSRLTSMSRSCVNHFDNCKFEQLSCESAFQALILSDQFERSAVLSTYGIMKISNGLMAKIAGIIVTYVVLMIEISP